MKIFLANLKNDDLQVFESEMKPDEHDLDIGVMRFPKPLLVRAEVMKSDDDLTVNAHVEGEASFSCSSCLLNFNNLFEKEVTLHYDIKGLDSVTIDSDVRDEIILEHPIRILCKPDCKGLCQFCGADLNQAACQCGTQSNKN